MSKCAQKDHRLRSASLLATVLVTALVPICAHAEDHQPG